MAQIDQEQKSFQLRFHEAVTSYVKAPLADRLQTLVGIGAITSAQRLKALQKSAKKKPLRRTAAKMRSR